MHRQLYNTAGNQERCVLIATSAQDLGAKITSYQGGFDDRASRASFMRRMHSSHRSTSGAAGTRYVEPSRKTAAEWLDGVHAFRVAKARREQLIEEYSPELFASGMCRHGVCKMLHINTSLLYKPGVKGSRVERMLQRGDVERAAVAPLMPALELSMLGVKTCHPCHRCDHVFCVGPPIP